MSRAEEITSEVRRLVLTCRAMETQLQQSVPKKTHQEVVTNMQATIDALNTQIESLRAEVQNSSSLKETIAGLGTQLASQNEIISSLTGTVASLNNVINGQKASIADISARFSERTVSPSLYDQTVSKLSELQAKVQGMVENSEYASLQRKCDELTETMNSMVPKQEFINLQGLLANSVPKEKFEALQATVSQCVPREQLAASQARTSELEAKLQISVPRSDYEELAAKIGLLAKEVSSITEIASVEPVQTQEQPSHAPTLEITEIQSQLSDIKAAEDTGAQTLKAVDASQGFAFSNTQLCATTPLEFLHDLEQAPVESIENHSKSGDFERWFKDVLADEATAEALRMVRESNISGDDLRTRLCAVISPRYIQVAN